MHSVSSKFVLGLAILCTGCIPKGQSKVSAPDQIKKFIESQAKLNSVWLESDGNDGYYGSALDKDGMAWNVAVTSDSKNNRTFKLKLTKGKYVRMGWIFL